MRVRAAHALARRRRASIASSVQPELRAQFDRDGFIVIRDLLPSDQFEQLTRSVVDLTLECREQLQGDTITCRVPIGPELLRQVPLLAELVEDDRWKAAMAYVASTRSEPLYYLQAIAGGVVAGPPDPQLELHADTFHPSMKAWLFLTDVGEDDRPLTYVAGSHRLTAERAVWERDRSTAVLTDGDRLSQRGSLRIAVEELADLALPQPTRFCVPANTLVIADTSGFHARADSSRPTLRIELWAYCRRSPFLPWTRGDLLSARPFAKHRAGWALKLVDWLEARGWMKQHWRPAGPWRDSRALSLRR
ncbi:MAG TPA: phytanoyl-CoA dioxygenase family protein [Sphingomicrobium sp.]|nr:phytanoyl-CoA dioxygenase family protein [Sphingomicrobium sp.]